MCKKVSVIIPNYNAEKYILKCINSVLVQTYKNIEIIIIDDGSTDESWNIIESIKEKNSNIIAIKQPNLNASIARNKGIELASGKYVLFLDSDDELFENSVELLVTEMEQNNVQMVIGNFIQIDENNNIIGESKEIKNTILCENPIECIGMAPNPSNKFFKLDIIRNNNIYFGNVRIGQDLNFYLKYILYCEKIKLINKDIYKWRKVSTSITNSYDLRIFGIVETFNDLEKFYKNVKKEYIYDKYIKIIEFRHYYIQMEKQKYFKTYSMKKLILNYFKINIKNVDVKKCNNFNQYKKEYIIYKIKCKLNFIYLSNLYPIIEKIFKNRINKKI